ncbi:hypothetical protein DEU56DRAFT_952119 [Suillus clintonianus]|uniref:uncharacterized protein n=1 Tax=Suillus clintonianus TaxID=1904413 RepID=UPI001B8626D9|nr:uncharacterized protein DEU56DRAFT_952119 [Suillus clintonianus]KAG2154064.1 hypothetical protein DEU56DRAFT_952119 [Suillus clintonianus]
MDALTLDLGLRFFVDRDMFMRFRGGGVGHKVTREWDEFLRNDGAAVSQDEEVIELREVADEVVDDNDSEGSASEDLGDEGNPVQVGADGEDDEFLAQEGCTILDTNYPADLSNSRVQARELEAGEESSEKSSLVFQNQNNVLRHHTIS